MAAHPFSASTWEAIRSSQSTVNTQHYNLYSTKRSYGPHKCQQEEAGGSWSYSAEKVCAADPDNQTLNLGKHMMVGKHRLLQAVL